MARSRPLIRQANCVSSPNAVSTLHLNHEPIAMLGLTQSELNVVTLTSVAVAVPTGILCALLVGVWFGFMWGFMAFAIVGGFLGLGFGFVLTKLFCLKKNDRPDGYLLQSMLVRFQRAKWLPPTGIFHYRRGK